jgi:HSP20 family protein
MSSKKGHKEGFHFNLEGVLGGLSDLAEKLGQLAEAGENLSRTGSFQGKDQRVKGVYGVSVKFGLGGEKPKVEPFGNIRRDKTSGQSVVHEIREPMVDVFEEADHTLVVAEMPGISEKDVTITLRDDLLEIFADSAEKKYRKEVLLPRAYDREKLQISCNNGILEIKCLP